MYSHAMFLGIIYLLMSYVPFYPCLVEVEESCGAPQQPLCQSFLIQRIGNALKGKLITFYN